MKQMPLESYDNTAMKEEPPVQKPKGAPIPTSFWGYVKGFGPGIVVVLTWLGAGDLVDSSVAGANYGYTLMWALAAALLVRFALVNTIAKFQPPIPIVIPSFRLMDSFILHIRGFWEAVPFYTATSVRLTVYLAHPMLFII